MAEKGICAELGTVTPVLPALPAPPGWAPPAPVLGCPRMRKIGLLAVLAWGCSSETLPPSNVVFLAGHESDLWTREPVPATIDVNLVADGHRTPLGEAPAPTTGLPITNRQVPLGVFSRFDATALDVTGAAVAREHAEGHLAVGDGQTRCRRRGFTEGRPVAVRHQIHVNGCWHRLSGPQVRLVASEKDDVRRGKGLR